MHDPVTWYKIKYTGEQIAQWDFQNNAAAFVLDVPLCNLLTSIRNFVPRDRVVQRAYWKHIASCAGLNANFISTSDLAGLFDLDRMMFVLLTFYQLMRTPQCDFYHKEFESH